ncbi:MAG: ACT domain-containing protein, partial [Clostridia bacterium]|nr:ACT domain-containing protein [Clostridia bacterium]
MKAVITVIGHDTVGILAKVSTRCAEHNANIIEVTQSVMEDLFAMVMLVDITKITGEFTDLQN